jgi:hypothetical protein
VLLAGAYLLACLYLWSGWEMFLPGADTPFGVRWTGPPNALQNLYFQFGKFYYFGAPILVGWVIGVIAARQRVKALWPTVGLAFIALMGGTAEIQASRSRAPPGWDISAWIFSWISSPSALLLRPFTRASFTSW